ncbi:MAG: Hsp70 family protein [Oscillospiraceae bacterium]|jgi:molecular chaperone DnaK|nr:Hsp70 family protein [Oscillospiraceae bacterium]
MSRIVGIDLGTSTSEIACIIDGVPVIIPNSLGSRVTPSIVHIMEDGTRLVGEPAAEYLLTRPECTFMEVKRLTGSGEAFKAHGKEYLPEELQAILLRYLAGCAEVYLGERIERAVITVPAYFTDVQRRATVKAGELAGLKVERILNEPTAAAMDYGLQNFNECQNILIYDFGGGTLDITVLELFDGVIDVKASCGNNHLGGKDLDEIIMCNLADTKNDMRAQMRLKKAAEECKIALSTQENYEISLPFLMTGKKNEPIAVEKTISRTEFEDWIREKVESTREPMMSALSDAGISPGNLDAVLLVGGSTRIPCVKRLVEETLGIEAKTLMDPDLAVAGGAAVQAGILDGIFSIESALVLTDVCPYTLGIASMHEGLLGDELVFSPIIHRNTTIPVERAEIFYTFRDYQTEVLVRTYQGESTDPDNNEFLGEVRLTGIPSMKRGKEPIEVAFSYDMNGILQVKARIVSTRGQVTSTINTAGVKPREVLDLSKWEQADGAKRCRPAIRKAERFIREGRLLPADVELNVTRLKEALMLGEEERVAEPRQALLNLLELIEETK